MTPPMGDDQKAAMAEGRRRAATVRRYLAALAGAGGRPEAAIRADLAAVASAMATTPDALERLGLAQRRVDLREELEAARAVADLPAREAAFVRVAGEHGRRKGLDRADWRDMGVPDRVLDAAGIDADP